MIFSREKQEKVDESIQKELYSKIGELQVQVDFLKKVLGKLVLIKTLTHYSWIR